MAIEKGRVELQPGAIAPIERGLWHAALEKLQEAEQRAEIFVLDRGTCSYSGRSLWIADYGIDPSYAIDWADHIVPASRGGKSTGSLVDRSMLPTIGEIINDQTGSRVAPETREAMATRYAPDL